MLCLLFYLTEEKCLCLVYYVRLALILSVTRPPCDQEALAQACDYIRKIRADMGGTNILAPLTWILRQPMISGHPRLLFLLTDGTVSNTGKVIELVRSHKRYIRQVLLSPHCVIEDGSVSYIITDGVKPT